MRLKDRRFLSSEKTTRNARSACTFTCAVSDSASSSLSSVGPVTASDEVSVFVLLYWRMRCQYLYFCTSRTCDCFAGRRRGPGGDEHFRQNEDAVELADEASVFVLLY